MVKVLFTYKYYTSLVVSDTFIESQTRDRQFVLDAKDIKRKEKFKKIAKKMWDESLVHPLTGTKDLKEYYKSATEFLDGLFESSYNKEIIGGMPKHDFYEEILGASPNRFYMWLRASFEKKLEVYMVQTKRIPEMAKTSDEVIEKMLESQSHIQQAVRSSVGVIQLGKSFGKERLESACQRALTIRAINYKSVLSILKNNLDQFPVINKSPLTHVTEQSHKYIRGKQYFQ